MSTIHICDVPQETWAELVAAARERGESMHSSLLALLKEAAQRGRNSEPRKRLDSADEENGAG
ncbi:hypothetical protein [Glycomyces arizonensis]|uniref:hypothetical protein n=1 Tax=Glycomyces arizonensis TaxID=256035 RepID=UPI0012EC6EDA|nr:hypothetical protein [Glycomyces arizonensis]